MSQSRRNAHVWQWAWMRWNSRKPWAVRCMRHNIKKKDKVRACVHAQVLCILRVFMSLYLLLMWFVSCLSSVLLSFFLLYVFSFRSKFSKVGGFLFTAIDLPLAVKGMFVFITLGTNNRSDCPATTSRPVLTWQVLHSSHKSETAL